MVEDGYLDDLQEEYDAAAATIDAIYKWLVTISFPFEQNCTAKPEWLDVKRLAEVWLAVEPSTHDNLDDWIWDICDSARWPRPE